MRDLREAYDPETPATLPGRTTLLGPARSTTGNVIPDAGSYSPNAVAATVGGQSPEASNVLMVSGTRSATHHPIMVAGPQIGYSYPGLILEMDLERPRDPRSRGHLGTVSRVRVHRAQPGLGLVADLGGSRSDRHVRRDVMRP